MKYYFLPFLFFCTFFIFGQQDNVWMHPNRGQWHDNVKYKVDLNGGEMMIENNGFTYLFHNQNSHNEKHDKAHKKEAYKEHVIKTNFIGSNTNHEIIENNKSTFYRNYFLGNDQSKWKSNIFSVSKIKYPAFYPGILMELEGKIAALEYTFYVSPGINPTQIKFSVEGQKSLKISKTGELIISHSFGDISESKPIAWTVSAEGKKSSVNVKFNLDKNIVSFSLPDGYDKNQTLVIDPQITFSSYTGSESDNWGCTATPDDQGNLFAGGTVFGTNYPTTAGVFGGSFSGGENIGYGPFDIGLSKFNANGTALIYSTYVGGNGNECPNSMICNAAGELYIMGVTSSTNFPTSAGCFDASYNNGSPISLESGQDYSGTDLFVIKINPTGSAFMAGTYVGGSGNDGINFGNSTPNDGDLVHNYGDNFRGEIILDNLGNVIVASSTRSTTFPVMNPSQNSLNGTQDAVLFKMNNNLSTMLWSTFYGGSGVDCGNAVAVNSNNDIYLTGGTISTNLTLSGGQQTNSGGGEADGFLTKFNGITGAVLSGTYIGTTVYDQSYFVQTDIDDFVYVYGQTYGAMPITPGLVGNSNASQFIRKYTANLSSLVWSTKVGGGSTDGSGRISPTAFLVSNCYEIYFAGWGGSLLGSSIGNFPITPTAFQTTSDGDGFYISVLSADASAIQYATYIGGPADDHVDGGTSRFDKSGRVYHAVCASCGNGNNGFVSTPGVISPTAQNANCNLAAFKFELNSITALVAEPNFIICIPNPVQFFNNSTEGDVFFWDFGDNSTSSEADPSHAYLTTGDFTVKLIVSDSEGCKAPDSISFVVSVGSFEPGSVVPPPTICRGAPYQLEAMGGTSYQWSPANVLDNANIFNPTATIFQNTDFTVIIIDSCGRDTVQVTLNVYEDLISVSNDTSICLGFDTPIQVFGAISQVWTPNQFISNSTSNNPTVAPVTTTYYLVTATTVNNCIMRDSVLIDVFFTPPLPIIDDSAAVCFGVPYSINVSGASTYFWTPNLTINSQTANPAVVSPTSSITYYCAFTNACGTENDSIYIGVIRPNVTAEQDTIICVGQSVELEAFGAIQYQWTPVGSINNPISSLITATPTSSTFYRVIGIDAFGCRDSATIFVQTFPVPYVTTGGSILAEIGDNVQLNAVANTVGTYYWSPESYISCTSCQSPIANPNFNYDYTVLFTDTNGCRASDLIHIDYKGVIYIPNTFTPDGNKFNQNFKAYGDGIINFEMLIFDRWGELIKTLNSIDEFWDGTYLGKICQDGTYTWKVTYSDITREFKTITGHVNLLK
jgi:gliding motility-associated-like protein